jgi:hypothetical protein
LCFVVDCPEIKLSVNFGGRSGEKKWIDLKKKIVDKNYVLFFIFLFSLSLPLSLSLSLSLSLFTPA